MSIINVILNANNFTIEHDSIVKDYAFNDLNFYYDSNDNNTLFATWRRTDQPALTFDATEDTIDINGTTDFADASEIADAMRPIAFQGGQIFGGVSYEGDSLITTITDLGVFVLLNVAYTLDPNSSEFALSGSNRIEYIGKDTPHVAEILGVINAHKTAGGQNEIYHLAFFVNGTQSGVSFHSNFEQQEDNTITLIGSLILKNGDLIDIRAAGINTTDDLEVEVATIQIHD